MTRLLGSKRPTARAATDDVDVTVRGRMVVAGARAAVARFVDPNGERTLANDPEFMKARARFSKDPLFAFIELGSRSFGMPSATSGDMDAIQSMIGMFAGAVAAGAGDPQSSGGLQASGAQGADLLAMAEASLGFSIKHNLIPTLGNEVAITLSGFNTPRTTLAGPVAKLEGPMPNGAAKRSSPQFMLILAVRDAARFEELLHRLVNGPTGSPGQPFARTLYRGATINSRKDFAYAITGGFFLAGGSPAELRRAIDAHALGSSLAAAAEFRQAFASRPAALRAYLSSRLSKELYELLLKEAAKSGAGFEETVMASQTSSPIALSLIPDEDGLMMEARVPTNLTLLALSSMFNAKPAPYGISPSPSNGVSDSGSPRTGARATPRLTDEDLRSRRP